MAGELTVVTGGGGFIGGHLVRALLEEGRTVRAVGEPAARFREDYLRILRAIRFATRLDFEIDEATWAAAKAESPGLDRLLRSDRDSSCSRRCTPTRARTSLM